MLFQTSGDASSHCWPACPPRAIMSCSPHMAGPSRTRRSSSFKWTSGASSSGSATTPWLTPSCPSSGWLRTSGQWPARTKLYQSWVTSPTSGIYGPASDTLQFLTQWRLMWWVLTCQTLTYLMCMKQASQFCGKNFEVRIKISVLCSFCSYRSA